MSNTIYNYDPSVDLTKHIFWQYNNAPAINSIINAKNEWFNTNQTVFWENWVKNVLNIKTANDYGLSIWGALLQVPRTYNVNGDDLTLTTNQYRTVLLARLKLLHTRATVPEINKLLKFLFGQYGKAYVTDNFDMTMTYHFNFNLSDLQLAVLQNVTLLPRPAGVEAIIVTTGDNVFGFNSVYDTVETYADLISYDTTDLPNNTILLVFSDSNNDDKATYYIWDLSNWTQLSSYKQLGQPFDQARFATYIHNV